LNQASKKFGPDHGSAEAALDDYLRGVVHRNSRAAALFLACFTFVLWPTDLIIFRGMSEVQHAIAWQRAFLIVVLTTVWVLLGSKIGPKRPTLILSVGGTLILFAVGYGLGELGGAQRPWIHLAYPALFFSVLAPVRIGPRTVLVTALAFSLVGGFLLPHPEHWHDPMLRLVVSFVLSAATMVVAVGHLAFRILRQSFYQSLALEKMSRALADLNATLELRVREQTGDLRRLTDHLVKAREEERVHISRELHDELGQELTALGLTLALTRHRFDKDPNSIAGNLAELDSLLQRTRATTRTLITELRPRMLDEMGLAAALEWLTTQTEQRAKIACRLTVDAPDVLPHDTSVAAFRIVQEALTNVARHAQAQKAEVTVRARDGELMLSVSDDGVGLPDKPKGSGVGLIGIRERVTTMSGRLDVESRPGAGTRLTVRLPLPAPPLEVLQ
jgi:signal transduction histidine kinase